MTTPAHQQQEYIITEEQMQDLYPMIHILFEQRAMEILQQVHTRPHSSVQSRDQVLDEVITFLKSKQNLSSLTDTYYGAAIKEIDTELRTQGSRDP